MPSPGDLLTFSAAGQPPTFQTPATSGTVTSVAMTVPSVLSISGSPITSSGTLGVTYSGTALPIANGGTAVTSVTTSPTATSFAGWDGNKNLSANSMLQGYATTATAASTTTLLVGSAQQQYFTGSTTQTVLLPVTSTLALGQSYTIVNNSSGVVTVQSSGSNTLEAMAANTVLIATVISTTGTGTASWSWSYDSLVDAGGTVTSVSVVSTNGFAGTVANATTTPAITIETTATGVLTGNGTSISGSSITQYDVLVGGASNAISSVGTGTSGQILQSGGGSANPAYSTSTYPSTNAVNTLLYASSANVMAALSTANNGVLITSGAGAPSISSTLPTAVQSNITQVGTITSGTWDGSLIAGQYGGTGVANTGFTMTLQGSWNNVATSATSASSLTPDSDTNQMYAYTALAAGISIAADSGSPYDGKRMTFRFLDNGSPQTITWTSGTSKSYEAVGISLPTTTVANKITYVGFIYNANASRWDGVATVTQA